MKRKKYDAPVWAAMLALLIIAAATVLRGQAMPDKPPAVDQTNPPATQQPQTLPLTPLGAMKVESLRIRIQLLQSDINIVAQEERVAHGVGNDWQIDLQHNALVKMPEQAAQPASPAPKAQPQVKGSVK